MPFGLSANRRSRSVVGEIPDQMKAVVVREHGGLEILKYDEESWSVPKRLEKGQVLVKNEYSGLNFIDVYYRSGLYTKELPFILGQEGGGTVVKKHRSVIDVEVGDKVVYLASGTYCEYTRVSEDKLVKVPNQLTIEAAITCMMQGLTAHYLVTDAQAGHSKKGDWILIYSVTSGTGQWAAQIAKLQGYRVIGTTSITKRDIIPKDWIDELIILDTLDGKVCSDFDSVDIVQEIMDITEGKGVACVLDGIGKNTSDISVNCLTRRGLWLSYGTASGPVPPMSLFKLTKKSAYCSCPKLGDFICTKEEFRNRAQNVFEAVILGDLNVRVDLIVPLENAREGHAYLEGGRSKGKVLFKCDNHQSAEEILERCDESTVQKETTVTTTATTPRTRLSFFGRRRNNTNNTPAPATATAPIPVATTDTTETIDFGTNEQQEAERDTEDNPNYLEPINDVDGDII